MSSTAALTEPHSPLRRFPSTLPLRIQPNCGANGPHAQWGAPCFGGDQGRPWEVRQAAHVVRRTRWRNTPANSVTALRETNAASIRRSDGSGPLVVPDCTGREMSLPSGCLTCILFLVHTYGLTQDCKNKCVRTPRLHHAMVSKKRSRRGMSAPCCSASRGLRNGRHN